MSIACGSPVDPFFAPEKLSSGMSYKTGGAPRQPRIIDGEATLVFVVAGQSLAANHGTGTLYVPVNASRVDQISIFDGSVSGCADPVVGATGSGTTWMTRFADALISSGKCSRVVLICCAIGGTSVAEWQPGAVLNPRLMTAFHRASSLGMVPDAVLWQQGESDSAMTKDDYKARLQSVIDSVRANGFSAPWFIARSTYGSGVAYPAIQQAQLEIVNGTTILQGPDSDSLTGVNRQGDQTHMTQTGQINLAALWCTKIVDWLI